MDADRGSTWLAIVFLGVFVVVYLWDAIAGATGAASVSDTVYGWAKRWPILPFAVGTLIGHLFWRGNGP